MATGSVQCPQVSAVTKWYSLSGFAEDSHLRLGMRRQSSISVLCLIYSVGTIASSIKWTE